MENDSTKGGEWIKTLIGAAAILAGTVALIYPINLWLQFGIALVMGIIMARYGIHTLLRDDGEENNS